MANIGIFCSASDDLAPIYYEQAHKLGEWIGKNRHTIYYGGTHQGLMEAVASSVNANGGTVIGVMPQFMYDNGLASNCADRIIVTGDMVERKNTMMEKSDLFIALPGGFGTLDEIFHVVACGQVGIHKKPVFLLNMNNFYGHLISLAEIMREERFTPKMFQQGLIPVDNVDVCVSKIAEWLCTLADTKIKK
ncbi:MAG: TIGR00730 family Rossman fold protein [Paludibacteraceae bacterium]|nr:TIGR00730 family Rossman fold protein [Paludibacteraceae bacterium]